MSETLPALSDLSVFMQAAGLQFTEISGSRVTGWIEFGTEQHTPWGMVHGGVYAAAVETAASMGASTAVADKGEFAVGVHNATNFLRPMTEGRVDLVAVPLFQGRTQQLWDVVITRSADAKPVARGQLRLQNVPRPAT
jgi:1,4-dihydroxy-2-naphthoyl-CoA hydrolase